MEPESNVNKPSQGLGDTIEKITHATGLDKVAEKVAQVTKKKGGCGCKKRRDTLNKAFPYKPLDTDNK
jgi:hypothetical protein